MSRRVYFLDTVHESLWVGLEQAGYTCVAAYTLQPGQWQSTLHDAFGLVIRSRIELTAHRLKALPSLRFVARSGSGLENIDLATCRELDVAVFNSPEGNRDAVAEHAIGALLALFNHIPRADAEVRRGLWKREENRGEELMGKTVGIVGYGVMGQAFAKRLRGFGCRILAYDKYKQAFGDDSVQEVSLQTLQDESDVISFHVPLTEETHHYFNNHFIQACSRNIWLINTSRGAVVNTAHLVDALKESKVRGACLDVLEYESKSLEKLEFDQLPEPMQYLVKSDRVILSPHVAGWTHQSYIKLSTVLLEKILQHFGSGHAR